MTRMIHLRSLLLLGLLPCLPAAAENRDFTDLQGRVLRASLEKIEGDEAIVKRSVDGISVRVKAITLSDADVRYLMSRGLTQAALNTTPFNAPGTVPQTAEALRANLENTHWDWRNEDDYPLVGSQRVVKDGAWQEVRFRRNGQASAWHKGKIVWDGRWEVLGPRSVKIAVRDAVGLVVEFDADVNSCKVVNERETHGKRLGRAPIPDPVVGRWRWNGGDIKHLREDGSAAGNGQWRRVRGDTIEVTWDQGAWIDTMRLGYNSKKLSGKNQKDQDVNAERVADNVK